MIFDEVNLLLFPMIKPSLFLFCLHSVRTEYLLFTVLSYHNHILPDSFYIL